MESRPIFLSMAAIDIEKAEANRWLPANMFPLRTHRIATAGGTDDCYEFSFSESKGDVRESRGFSFKVMIGIMDILQF